MNLYRFLPCVRIGTVGDSLAGQGVPANWQYYLWRTLTASAKCQIQFVGTDNGPEPIWTNPYPGERIDQIDTRITATIIPTIDPDILIVMAGTNDALQGASSSTMITRVRTLLTNAFTARPRMRIIYAKPPPLSLSGAGVTQAAIDALAAFAAGLSADVNTNHFNKLVSVVDCWTGFDAATMLADGIHQNALGAVFMANAMLQAGTGVIVEGYSRQTDSISI